MRAHVSPPAVVLVAIVFLLAPGSGFPSSDSLVDQQPEVRGPGRIRFEVDAQVVDRLFRSRSARVVGFPLPGGLWVDLEVASSDVVHAGTRFAVAGPDGIHEAEGPSARFFRGGVAGDPESLVSLNLIDGHLAGFVRTAGSEYSFGPSSFAPGGPMPRRVEVIEDSVESGSAGTCDGEVHPSSAGLGMNDSKSLGEDAAAMQYAVGPGTSLVAEVAVEGTVEWVARHGGAAAAAAYTLNLMAQVSAIYENDVNVQIQIPYILMNAAEPDGYSGGSSDTSTHLSELRAKWNGTPSLRGVFRSAVHLLGTYPSGGKGRAYIDVLCDGVPANATSHDFGVTLLQGAGGTWERRLVAHELGHNFSSPHTHCYTPEIDRCDNAEAGCYSGPVVQTTGTVMSYCDTRLSVFHQRVIDEALRPAAEAAYPACMGTVAGLPGGLGLDPGSALHVRQGVSPGSVVLSWGVPCNDATVPNQDYAIYQGTLGSWSTLTSLTCSTGHANSWVVNAPGANRFWLVVPQTSSSEGSYGLSSFGERPQAASPCRPQAIGACEQ